MNFLNVIIRSPHVKDTDRTMLFPDNELVFVFDPQDKDIFDLLVILEAFTSKGQAKKNWTKCQVIPNGWSEFFVGKRKRHLCIWNPTE